LKNLVTILVLFISGTVFAQWGDEQLQEKPSFKDKVFVGGGFGFSLNNTYDYLAISPMIGYRINQRLATGINLIYRYAAHKYVTPKVSTNDFGIGPFVRCQLYGPLFLHAEYEYLNNEYVLNSAGETIRQNFSSFMAGGGYFKPLGRRVGFFVIALYNFSYRNPTSPYDFYPYSSPWVLRAGVTAGF